MSTRVFYRVLDPGREQDDDERQHGDFWSCSAKDGKDLKDDETQEIDIGYSSKLLEQILLMSKYP